MRNGEGLTGQAAEAQTRTKEPDVRHIPPSGLAGEPDTALIAGGMTVSGALHGHGVIRVEGVVEGKIEQEGTVVITDTGVVKGEISADTVYLAGFVEGSISAKKLLRLEMTGTLSGDAAAASLVIQDGGCLNGWCTMTEAGREPVFLY